MTASDTESDGDESDENTESIDGDDASSAGTPEMGSEDDSGNGTTHSDPESENNGLLENIADRNIIEAVPEGHHVVNMDRPASPDHEDTVTSFEPESEGSTIDVDIDSDTEVGTVYNAESPQTNQHNSTLTPSKFLNPITIFELFRMCQNVKKPHLEKCQNVCMGVFVQICIRSSSHKF